MFTRDAITAAVACSCLFLMVANQSVNACSCYEAIDANETCLAKEIWDITIKSEDKHETRGDGLGYYLYNFHIDHVVQSAMQFQSGNEAFFKITNDDPCTVSLTTDAKYLIAAERTEAYFSPVQICNRDGDDNIIC
ncbi:hypothetical protein CHS0354_037353, partial [Potamilus streckersoni]